MIKSYFSKRDRQAIVALTLTVLAGCGFLWVLGEYGEKQESKEVVEKKGWLTPKARQGSLSSPMAELLSNNIYLAPPPCG